MPFGPGYPWFSLNDSIKAFFFSKLNADAPVAKTQNRGAVGVICRDDQGVFQGA